MSNAKSNADTPVPRSRQVLGSIILALRLREDVAKAAGVNLQTFDRWADGSAGVSELRHRNILKAIVCVLSNAEIRAFFSSADLPESEVDRILTGALALACHRWDSAVGEVRSTLRAVRPEWAVRPFLRMAVYDLAIRYGAWLRIHNAPALPLPEVVPPAWATPEGMKPILKRLREAAGLTREKLVEKVGVDRKAVEAWLDGQSHPRHEQIRALAGALHCATCPAPKLFELKLRMEFALSSLARQLAGFIGWEAVEDLGLAFEQQAHTVVWFLGHSKKAREHLDNDCKLWIVLGSASEQTQWLVRTMASRAPHKHASEDILQLARDWTPQLLHRLRYLASEEELVEHATRQAGSHADIREVVAAVFQATLTAASRSQPEPPLIIPVVELPRQYAVLEAAARAEEEADACSVLNDWPGAIVARRRCVELDPYDGRRRSLLGCALWRVPEYEEEARLQCLVACILKPGWAIPFIEIGIVHIEHKRLDEAIAHFAVARERYGDSPHLLYHIGLARERAEDHEGAVAAYTQAVELRLDRVDAWWGLARCYQRLGRKRDADNAVKRARILGGQP